MVLKHHQGWLENGLNLVNSGTGYYHYLGTDGIDTDDWGVLHLINMIEGAGRDWYDNFMTPARIGVGDMSLRNGGKWDDHSSHENGLDVDVRYVRNDNQDSSLNIADDQSHYDTAATSYLMNLFVFSASVQIILYDSVNAHLVGGPLLHWPGHSDHFHIRIDDPDGTNN